MEKPSKPPIDFEKAIKEIIKELNFRQKDAEQLGAFVRSTIEAVLKKVQDNGHQKKSLEELSYRMVPYNGAGIKFILDLVENKGEQHKDTLYSIAFGGGSCRGQPDDFKGCSDSNDLPELVPRRQLSALKFKGRSQSAWYPIGSKKTPRQIDLQVKEDSK